MNSPVSGEISSTGKCGRRLRPEDDGKFVAIDVGTGDYEMDEDDYAAIALAVAEAGGRYLADEGGLPAAYRIGVVR